MIKYLDRAGGFWFGSDLIQKFKNFSGSVYFEFGSEKSCSKPKIFERIHIKFLNQVNFYEIYKYKGWDRFAKSHLLWASWLNFKHGTGIYKNSILTHEPKKPWNKWGLNGCGVFSVWVQHGTRQYKIPSKTIGGEHDKFQEVFHPCFGPRLDKQAIQFGIS